MTVESESRRGDNAKSYAERYEAWRALITGRPLTDEERCEIVRLQAQRLIAWLYDPRPEVGWLAASNRAHVAGLEHDAINWGDLDAVEVTLTTDGTFIITVEEASPDAHHFRRWLEKRMADWGWQVRVLTEW